MKRMIITAALLLCTIVTFAQGPGSGGGPGGSGSGNSDAVDETTELEDIDPPEPGTMKKYDFVEYISNGWELMTNGPESVLWATCMSPNGRYVSCWRDSNVGTALLDMWEGEYYERNGSGEGSAVSNYGLVIGTCGTYNPVTGSAPNASGYGMSSDGSIIVGNSVYNNGKTISLPRPTTEQVGGEYQGMRAIAVSDDGAVVCGYVEDWFSDQGMVLWRLNDEGGYDLDPVCKDMLEFEFSGDRPYLQFAPTGMSHNGKWIGLVLTENDGAFGGPTHVSRYNVETGEIVEPEEIFNCSSTRVANDGTILVHTGDIDSSSRRAMIWLPDDPSPVYLSELYPDVPEFADYDDDYWNYGVDISSDGRFIAGMGWHYIEGYDEYYARRVSWYFDREAYGLIPDGIDNTSTASRGLTIIDDAYYTLDGKRLNAPQKGLNIVKSSGETKKVLVK